MLDKAIKFAVDAHSGSVRKGTPIPYILHPLETAAIAATMTDDDEVLCAAVLHDTVEDTPVTIEEIRTLFGQRVACLVGEETENKRRGITPDETWMQRKQETIQLLCSETQAEVKMLALADKLSNIRSIHNDLLKMGDSLWCRFNQKDKSRHEWYYRSIGEATKELCSFPAWQEYAELVERVFGPKVEL